MFSHPGQRPPGDHWVDAGFEERGPQPMTEEEAEWEWQRQLAEQADSQDEGGR